MGWFWVVFLYFLNGHYLLGFGNLSHILLHVQLIFGKLILDFQLPITIILELPLPFIEKLQNLVLF